MGSNIEQLRDVLFAQLADLRDEKKPLDLDRLKGVVNVSGRIIETAKVEVEFMKVSGGTGTGFIENKSPKQIAGAPVKPAPNVTVHRIKG